MNVTILTEERRKSQYKRPAHKRTGRHPKAMWEGRRFYG